MLAGRWRIKAGAKIGGSLLVFCALSVVGCGDESAPGTGDGPSTSVPEVGVDVRADSSQATRVMGAMRSMP